jgi:hypothetical protein
MRALQVDETAGSAGLPSKAKKKRLRKKAKGADKEEKHQEQISNALVRVGCGGDSQFPQGEVIGDNGEIEGIYTVRKIDAIFIFCECPVLFFLYFAFHFSHKIGCVFFGFSRGDSWLQKVHEWIGKWPSAEVVCRKGASQLAELLQSLPRPR